MATNTRELQEKFERELAEILHLGLAVSVAMKHLTHGLLHRPGQTARVRFNEQEYMIEATNAAQPAVHITLIE